MHADGDATIARLASRRVVLDDGPCPGIVEIALADPFLRVRSITPADDLASDVLDVGDAYLLPAPLDLHFHGAGGITVPPAGRPEGIDEVLRRASAAHACTPSAVPAPAYEWLATLPVPTRPAADPVAHVAAASSAIVAAPGSACAGIRIEGLFLNTARAGVWPPETFRALDVGLLEQLHAAADAGGAPLRIVDIAPEIAEPDVVTRFIERARELGVVIALAHSDATYEQARHAIEAGATLATHLWNAMRPVVHRDPGIVAACLTSPSVTSELICDGVHLHPATIALSTRAAGDGRWAVISDASPFAGVAPGEYEWAGTTVHHDGVALHDAAGHLAGSASLAWTALDVLAPLGVDPLRTAHAMGSVPRCVLDPDRGMGLRVGDPLWVFAPSTLTS